MIGIRIDEEPVVALAFDVAAAFRLQQAENEWNETLFGNKASPTQSSSPPADLASIEYW